MLPDLSLYYPLSRTFFFFFNDTATTEIYTLSLHDALPIAPCRACPPTCRPCPSERGCHLGYWRGPEGLGVSQVNSAVRNLRVDRGAAPLLSWPCLSAACVVAPRRPAMQRRQDNASTDPGRAPSRAFPQEALNGRFSAAS